MRKADYQKKLNSYRSGDVRTKEDVMGEIKARGLFKFQNFIDRGRQVQLSKLHREPYHLETWGVYSG